MAEFPSSTPRTCGLFTIARLRILSYCLFALTIAAFAVAIWLPPVIQSKLDSGIRDFIQLNADEKNENSENWNNWANGNPSSPVYYDVYAWNISNPIEILFGQKPILKQIGPYKFKEIKIQFDTSFIKNQDQNELLVYKTWEYYEFLPDLSVGDLSDSIVSLNVPFQLLGGLDSASLNSYKFQSTCFSSTLNQYNRQQNYTDLTRFFQTVSVGDLAFGFTTPALIDCAMKIASDRKAPISPSLFRFPGIVGNSTMEEAAKIGYSAIFTGRGNEKLTRAYHQWEGLEFLAPKSKSPFDFYPFTWGANMGLPNGASPNQLRGTAGLQFNPSVDENQRIEVFISELQRVLLLQHFGETVDKGITLYHFTLDPTTLLNATEYPSNAQYYQYDFVGLLNETRVFGIPIFASKPHFLDGDDRVSSQLIGLAPNPALHETYLDVEPMSGATMHAHKRLQINFHLTPIDSELWGIGIRGDLFVPLMWIDEHAQISDSDASKFRSSVYLARDLLYFIPIVGTILVGLFTILIFVTQWAIEKRFKTQTGMMLNAAFENDGHAPLLKEREITQMDYQ